MKGKAIIAGAGPAGLTAAYELLRQTGIVPEIYEESAFIGGISRTARYKGNRMDIGGHRFFSKEDAVTRWWEAVLPAQTPEGPDPELTDDLMLLRQRISRIYFLRKFFDYPVSLKRETLAGMGFRRTLKVGFGYLHSCIRKLPETSLENFYINRFGRPLYEMFFEDYTEKVWGIHPSRLGADWGSQRVKGLSITAVLADMLARALHRSRSAEKVQTSLIEQFIYPKYGPGQLWEKVADKVREGGGSLALESRVCAVNVQGNKVVSVSVQEKDGSVSEHPCDCFLSSMPVKDLVAALRGIDIPSEVAAAAEALPYRDFITVGLCLDKKKVRRDLPDTWIYIQERDVKLGRLQVFNNWSPYLVADPENTLWMGLEYFCSEGDALWEMGDADFIAMAAGELEKIGLVQGGAVLDACRIKVRKAYPAYYGSYAQMDAIRNFLDSIQNLWCIGRNGQHRYNNMDHSMMTAMECVRCIREGSTDKSAVWNVNTDEAYHESKEKR